MRRQIRKLSEMIGAVLMGVFAAPAQNQAPHGMGIDGLLDVYFGWNPGQPCTNQNQWRLFDGNANAWSFSLARVALDRDASPLGFHLEAGTGHAYKLMHSFDRAPHLLQYVPQAYVKWKPFGSQALQLDFGKFYTSTGVEVLDTDQNWNYSRSLLFSWAQPAYHFGLRGSAPLGKHLTAGVQLVNGWNHVRDNNGGKTVGLTTTLSWSKVSWTQVYYFGPEKDGTNRGWRHLYDTSLMLTPTERLSFYVNLDHGIDQRLGGGSDRWAGVAGAARIAAGRNFTVSSRLEWFYDPDGFATGTAQALKEITVTVEWKPCRGFAPRLEYRRDWSDEPTFAGRTPALPSRSQDTLVLGLLATFRTKR